MDDEFEQQAWVRLGVAAAMARAGRAEQVSFVQELATLLARTLPERTDVVYGGLPLTRSRPVKQVSVRLEDRLYVLDSGRSGLTARRTITSRGIALRTEEVPLSEWMAEVTEQLERRAQAPGG